VRDEKRMLGRRNQRRSTRISDRDHRLTIRGRNSRDFRNAARIGRAACDYDHVVFVELRQGFGDSQTRRIEQGNVGAHHAEAVGEKARQRMELPHTMDAHAARAREQSRGALQRSLVQLAEKSLHIRRRFAGEAFKDFQFGAGLRPGRKQPPRLSAVEILPILGDRLAKDCLEIAEASKTETLRQRLKSDGCHVRMLLPTAFI
jgi:hypothetical protein